MFWRLAAFVVFMTIASSVSQSAEDYRQEYQKAIGLLREGEYDAAIDILQVIGEGVSKPGQFHNLIGIAYIQKKDWQNALSALEKAESEIKDSPEIYTNLATVYMTGIQNYELALENYNKALALDPRFSRALFGSAWVYLFEKKNAEEAQKRFRTALELSPDFAEAYYGLGLSCITLGKNALVLTPVSKLKALGRADLAQTLELMLQGKTAGESQPQETAAGSSAIPQFPDFSFSDSENVSGTEQTTSI